MYYGEFSRADNFTSVLNDLNYEYEIFIYIFMNKLINLPTDINYKNSKEIISENLDTSNWRTFADRSWFS